MKPVTTWIVLANTRHARVVVHAGIGKGLHFATELVWEAEEAGLARDKAGVGHSIAGPGVAAVEQTNPQERADLQFARKVCDALEQELGQFHRLIIAAGPRMLGLMRSVASGRMKDRIAGEIAKDLSGLGMDQIEAQVGELLAV